MYNSMCICFERQTRGKGLRKELISRSHKLAQIAGCSHAYVLSTGKYSQAIFQQLGYRLVQEVKYADYEVDSKGRPFFDDHGEHEVFQVVVKEF